MPLILLLLPFPSRENLIVSFQLLLLAPQKLLLFGEQTDSEFVNLFLGT
jgi:hypothetical protein